MPKGVFKGTDEELKKLSEFVAKYNKNNKKLTTKFVVSFYFECAQHAQQLGGESPLQAWQ